MKKRKIQRLLQQEDNKVPASITVEAAFVIPIIILTIFAIVYLAFYLHDISLIRSKIDLSLHKAGMNLKHEGDIDSGEVVYEEIGDRGVFYLILGNSHEEEAGLIRLLEQELSKGLFLVKIKDRKAEVDKWKVKITVGTVTEISLPGLSNLMSYFPSKEITGEYPIHNPAETIRAIEVILDTGSSIKGIDELKEKMETIINKE